MILGTGADLIDIRRVERVLERHGDRFINRCFTTTEIEAAERRAKAGACVATYAKRFAAKEACAKALGTGFSYGVYMKDIGVINNGDGKPGLSLKNGAKKRLNDIVPKGMQAVIHLTLTDEPPIAEAYVIVEALPKK